MLSHPITRCSSLLCIGLTTATLWLVAVSSASAQLQCQALPHGLVITNGKTGVIEYIHTDSQVLRPHFTRAYSPTGYLLTRANPPVAGVDAVDHPAMHPGIWLAFGDINGQDFWRNKARIEHVRFTQEPTIDKDHLTFATENRLMSAESKSIGTLDNHLQVILAPSGTIVLWQATLSAADSPLSLGDQEEMGFGVRLATPLIEKKGGVITNSAGLKTASKTWGQAAQWCDYSGQVEGRTYGITTFASPKNLRESWWHNRDYGLCVANPFAKAAMKQGSSDPITIQSNQSQTFTFGAILHDAPGYDPAAAYQQALVLGQPR